MTTVFVEALRKSFCVFFLLPTLLLAQNKLGTTLLDIEQSIETCMKNKDFDKLSALTQMLLEEQKGDEELYYLGLLYRAKLHSYRNETEQADWAYEELLRWQEQRLIPEVLDTSYLENRKAYALYLFDRGSYSESERELRKTLDYCEPQKAEFMVEYLRLLSSLNSTLIPQGKYAEAELLSQNIYNYIEANPEHKETLAYGNLLNNLGAIAQNKQELDKALRYYEEAGAHYKKLGVEQYAGNYIAALSNRANIYTSLYIRSQDESYFQKSKALLVQRVAIEKKTKSLNHSSHATTLGNLAALYLYKGDYAEAEKLFLQAKAIFKYVGGTDNYYYLIILNNLGSLYRRWGKYEESEQSIQRALALNIGKEEQSPLDSLLNMPAEACISPQVYLESLELLARLEEARGQKDKHYSYLKQGLSFRETMRQSFHSEQDKLDVLSSYKAPLGDLLELALKEQKEEQLRESFYFAELGKAAQLADITQSRKTKSLSPLPEVWKEQEGELQAKLAKHKAKKYKQKTESEKAQFFETYIAIEKEIESFRKKLKDSFPRYYQSQYSSSVRASASDVQTSLDTEELFISYSFGFAGIYAFALSPSTFKSYKLDIDPKQFAQRLAALEANLTNYQAVFDAPNSSYRDFVEQAFWCYQSFLEPILSDFPEAKKLLISGEQKLASLPFEVFLSELPDSASCCDFRQLPYLIKSYSVSYQYSASLWQQGRKQNREKTKGTIGIFQASYERSDSSALARRSKALHALRESLFPLPYAAVEMKNLEQSFVSRSFEGQDASELGFKSQAKDFALLHIIAHGLYNKQNPLNSLLALTEDGNPNEDNLLEAWEIAQLDLSAQLVCLSACETGYGVFRQGEGVFSLGYAFLQASVPSLIISLWQVNDMSTAQLMPLFYEELSTGMDIPSALQKAKLQYLERASSSLAAHPAFWAAFVHIGKTEPVQLNKKKNWTNWLYAGLALLLALLFWYYKKREPKL